MSETLTESKPDTETEVIIVNQKIPATTLLEIARDPERAEAAAELGWNIQAKSK